MRDEGGEETGRRCDLRTLAPPRLDLAAVLVGALALAMLAAGCAAPGTANVQTDRPKEREQIERRLQEVLVAAERKDFDRLESYHLYGPGFTRFSGESPVRQDAAATRKSERDGLASLTGLTMRAEQLKIDVFGDVGIATFILDCSFDTAGRTVHKTDRTTLVFVKEGREWKIAHEHLTPVALPKVGGVTQPATDPSSSAAGPRR
jgi:ketosteroid isomerase-like protein